jgi:hypothetical protein
MLALAVPTSSINHLVVGSQPGVSSRKQRATESHTDILVSRPRAGGGLRFIDGLAWAQLRAGPVAILGASASWFSVKPRYADNPGESFIDLRWRSELPQAWQQAIAQDAEL